MGFREDYGATLRPLRSAVREPTAQPPEDVIQFVWYEQRFATDGLETDDGRRLRIVSPGWWNREEGPDFKGAQLEINGHLRNGDVEIHLDHGSWKAHGHAGDPRYEQVRLVVVLDSRPPRDPPRTPGGRRIPCLLLRPYLMEDIDAIASEMNLYACPHGMPGAHGRCASIVEEFGPGQMKQLVALAGEWRMVQKAQALRERMERTEPGQAIYEALMQACGFQRYKYPFRILAEQLPYGRVRQLALQDGQLPEAALLRMAGLLPEVLDPEASGFSHHQRLTELAARYVPGLRPLPLQWPRTGVRPINYPERRIAGVARLLARTASNGLADTLDRVWAGEHTAKERRRAFEELFPRPMGFWAEHCTWTGRPMASPAGLVGQGRARSIIGNVFVPAGIALARRRGDRVLEEKALALFRAMPKEPGNKVLRIMLPRIFGPDSPPRMNFQLQQGLLQMFHDWCEPNPSCRNCPVAQRMGDGGGG